jgi:hypothetical protein
MALKRWKGKEPSPRTLHLSELKRSRTALSFRDRMNFANNMSPGKLSKTRPALPPKYAAYP